MKSVLNIIGTILLASSLASPGVSEAKNKTSHQSSEKVAVQAESELVSNGHYTNKDKQTVHSPSKSVSGQTPAGASAKCRDGTFSFSQNRSGTCSHHGGVAQWL